jgi:Recombinase/Resolvase, N terminal domain
MGRFRIIILVVFSRLARRQEEQTVLIALFKEYGVRVESITEKLPDEDRIASVIRGLYGFASEIEHDRAVYRMHRGKMNRVANGNLTGFGKAKYGYSYIDTQDETSARYIINHRVIHIDSEGTHWAEPSVVLFCVDKLLIRWSCHGITKRLTQLGVPTPKGSDIWTATTVHRLLVEDWYTQTDDIVVMRWKMVKGKQVRRSLEEQVSIPRADSVPPLYDRETYDRVQEQLKLNKENALRSNKPYNQLGLLRVGYVRCGVCSKSMRGHYYNTNRKQGPDYCCKVNNGKDDLLHHHCVSINMEVVDTEEASPRASGGSLASNSGGRSKSNIVLSGIVELISRNGIDFFRVGIVFSKNDRTSGQGNRKGCPYISSYLGRHRIPRQGDRFTIVSGRNSVHWDVILLSGRAGQGRFLLAGGDR